MDETPSSAIQLRAAPPSSLEAEVAASEADSVGDALRLVPNGYSHTLYSQVPGWAAVAQFMTIHSEQFGNPRSHSALVPLVAFNVCAASLGVPMVSPNQTF